MRRRNGQFNEARHTYHGLRSLLKYTLLPFEHSKTVYDTLRDAYLSVLGLVNPLLLPDEHLQSSLYYVEQLVVRFMPVRRHVEFFRARADVGACEVGAFSEECLGRSTGLPGLPSSHEERWRIRTMAEFSFIWMVGGSVLS